MVECRGGASTAGPIVLATALYCVCVSAIPIYAKRIFDGSFGVSKFQYPCTAAFLQLGTAGALLCLLNIVLHTARGRTTAEDGSWLFGPHFRFKIASIAPAGVAFGLKYAVTNVALSLVDNSTHVLLSSTELIWIFLLAVAINRERPGILETIAVTVCIAANLLVAFSCAQAVRAPAFPILLNLLAPLVGAACISTLRTGVASLFDSNNRLGGKMTKIEFTGIKLVLASLVALSSAMVLESGSFSMHGSHDPWWVALDAYPVKGTSLILASGLLTVILHVDLAWLAWLTSATAVGILSEVKVLPQWSLNQLFGLPVQMSPSFLMGASLGLIGSALYATASYITRTRGKLVMTAAGFEWLHCGQTGQRSILLETSLQPLPTSSSEPAASGLATQAGAA